MSSRGKKKTGERAPAAGAPRIVKEKGFGAFDRRSSKWLYLGLAVLFAVMFALPCVKIEIKLDDTTSALLGGEDTSLSISSPVLIGAGFLNYDDAFDYIKYNVPALKRAIDMGQEATIDSKATSKLKAQLDTAYVATAALSWAMMFAFAALLAAAVAGCTKLKMPRAVVDAAVYIASALVLVTFVVAAYAQTQGTKDVAIRIGAGLGISTVAALAAVVYTVWAAVLRRKTREKNGQKM